MVIEICLIIISIMLTIQVAVLIGAVIKAKRAKNLLESNLDQVRRSATHLINNLSGLSEDIREKAKALDFISYPLRFFSHKKSSGFSLKDESNNSSKEKETLLQLVKWVALSMTLIKFTKELKDKYGK